MNGQTSAFVAPDEYKSRIEQLLDDEQRLSLAIAFWGKGAVELVSSRPGKDFRILCNLMSGGTNPYVIQELRGLARESDGRIQIHQCNQLHAKVVFGSCQALIGSANVSTNGLGLGHQGVAHWLEAGVLTSDESVVGSCNRRGLTLVGCSNTSSSRPCLLLHLLDLRWRLVRRNELPAVRDRHWWRERLSCVREQQVAQQAAQYVTRDWDKKNDQQCAHWGCPD